MLPVVTIIGRPNVGKSTLFNCLTATKDALVVDLPGTTRDRNYGFAHFEGQKYIVIDTAGINDQIEKSSLIINQIKKAINESTLILFVVDAATGLATEDLELANKLRTFSKKVILVINKIDGINIDLTLDFFTLGFSEVMQIAAKTGRGTTKLAEKISNYFDLCRSDLENIDDHNLDQEYIKVAIVGQPNVGKSTLINNILREERLVVFDSPGTTRDSIYIPTVIDKRKYILIDTAGVRKKAKIKETIEKFSIIKTMEAITKADVAVLIIDAQKGLVEQDLKLIDFIINAGRSLVIAVNKWDLINKLDQKKLQNKIKNGLTFINFIDPIPIAAISGIGVQKLFKEIHLAFRSATIKVSTNKLTLLLKQAITDNQLPLSHGRRIKLRYAHLGGHLPFRIIIHGNQANSLPDHYRKYLSNFFREKLCLKNTMVHIILKNSENPYIK